MQRIFKVVLLSSCLLAASMAVASMANATTILPANTAVSGKATDATLTYGGSNITCTNSTATGTTSSPASASLSLVVDFNGTCSGFGNTATIVCTAGAGSTITLHANATGSGNGDATVTLDTGFHCSITIKVFGSSICSITISGKQILSALKSVYNAATKVWHFLFGGISATKDAGGSALCGPASATASFSGTYAMTPTNLTITNP
jgi:hypothetical protein